MLPVLCSVLLLGCAPGESEMGSPIGSYLYQPAFASTEAAARRALPAPARGHHAPAGNNSSGA